jgi:hypothetical protein
MSPGVVLKTDSLMHAAIQNMFYRRAVHLAECRHGAIYDVRADMTHLRAVLSDVYREAFVSVGVPARLNDAHVIIKVNRMSPAAEWNTWLRYRVREAKMHAAVYEKLESKGLASCQFVPPLYFAGVDPSSGLFFTVMQRPQGTLVPITNLIKRGTFTMTTYRSLEAAIGNVWNVGAMMCDVSAGNILVSSNGSVSVVDFDSSIVYPPHISARLHARIDSLYRSVPLSRCMRIKHSSVPELVALWDLVMKPNNDDAVLKQLAIGVYGRKTWLPDVTMLRILFDVASSGVSRSSGTSRRRLFTPIKKFFKPFHRESESSFKLPSLKLRRMVALPENSKHEWKPRHHGKSSGSRYSSSLPRISPRRVVDTNTTNNNNNNNTKSVVVNRRVITVPNAPRIQTISPAALNLVNQRRTNHAMSEGIRENINAAPPSNNVTTPSPSAPSAPSPSNYMQFLTLQEDRKRYVIDYEIEKFKKSDAYKTIRKDLLEGKITGGWRVTEEKTVLDHLLDKQFPGVRWDTSSQSKKKFRLEHVDTIIGNFVESAILSVLNSQIYNTTSRQKQYVQAIMTKLQKTGSLIPRP